MSVLLGFLYLVGAVLSYGLSMARFHEKYPPNRAFDRAFLAAMALIWPASFPTGAIMWWFLDGECPLFRTPRFW